MQSEEIRDMQGAITKLSMALDKVMRRTENLSYMTNHERLVFLEHSREYCLSMIELHSKELEKLKGQAASIQVQFDEIKKGDKLAGGKPVNPAGGARVTAGKDRRLKGAAWPSS